MRSRRSGGGRRATATRPATFGEVFAVGEFRPLFGSYLLSTIGDELARVALTAALAGDPECQGPPGRGTADPTGGRPHLANLQHSPLWHAYSR